jgi:DNA-binding NarL/FixJ family response regulator
MRDTVVRSVERFERPRPGDVSADRARAIRTSIVSESQLLCEGIFAMLARLLNIAPLGSYGGGPPCAEILPNPPGHVVLLDYSMGHKVVLSWLRHWHSLAPTASIIVIELENNVDAIVNCVESGASGYVLQGASSAELAVAVENAQQSKAICSPEVSAHLFTRLATLKASLESAAAPPSLTARELEVLRCLAANYSNQQIADQLVIEVRTVKHHVHNILEKLKLRHRWDAARFAVAQGWLEPGAES